jgi:hypothetical protein
MFQLRTATLLKAVDLVQYFAWGFTGILRIPDQPFGRRENKSDCTSEESHYPDLAGERRCRDEQKRSRETSLAEHFRSTHSSRMAVVSGRNFLIARFQESCWQSGISVTLCSRCWTLTQPLTT